MLSVFLFHIIHGFIDNIYDNMLNNRLYSNSQIEITREASLEETVEKKGENTQIEENIQTENITEINMP